MPTRSFARRTRGGVRPLCSRSFLAVTLAACGATAGSQVIAAPLFVAARSFDTGSGPGNVAIGDLNGDGKPDLAVPTSNKVSVFAGYGDGTFATRVDHGTGTGPFVAIGDLNGDGKPDLAVSSPNALVSVLLGNGDGTFAAKVDYGTGAFPPRWRSGT